MMDFVVVGRGWSQREGVLHSSARTRTVSWSFLSRPIWVHMSEGRAWWKEKVGSVPCISCPLELAACGFQPPCEPKQNGHSKQLSMSFKWRGNHNATRVTIRSCCPYVASGAG